MHVDDLLFLIPLLPLLGFALNGLFGSRFTVGQVGLVACAGPVASFVLSVFALLGTEEGHDAHQILWQWIATGTFQVDFGLFVDPLTAVMLMNVTGIGSLIHLYSYGYMHEDPSFARFMAYLNLFLCAMLLLVMGDNLLVLFVGWEGVGLCSYLLIGFWYSNLSYTDAGRKAFVVNRIGDFAFLLGAFTLWGLTGTLNFQEMAAWFEQADAAAVHGTLVFAGAMLFLGATGKSAQLPLFAWLPDAMAGPTPVSALIHAATMVTAGLYLIGRMDFFFVLVPEVTQVVGFVAACTSLFTGLMAVGQTDIKKVLAYSTVSQLGFMFAGMATGLWFTGLYHVVTHAFFKALLFLGAGAVIHAMHHEQDIRKMGGLWHDLRGVSVLFLIGAGALAGIPWVFAGFWSKDEILAAVLAVMLHEGGLWFVVFPMLLATAGLTAFYTTRLILMTFFGPKADPHRHLHAIHWTMMAPLVVLAVLSTGLASFVGSFYHHLTERVFVSPHWVEAGHDPLHETHLIALVCSLAVVTVGIGAGWMLYRVRGNAVAATLEAFSQRLGIDAAYDLVAGATMVVANALYFAVDRAIIDEALVTWPGLFVRYFVGEGARRTQPGVLSVATASTLLGAIAVLVWMVVANG
jgi:NADH-quinone oxidoreductase subunit L